MSVGLCGRNEWSALVGAQWNYGALELLGSEHCKIHSAIMQCLYSIGLEHCCRAWETTAYLETLQICVNTHQIPTIDLMIKEP